MKALRVLLFFFLILSPSIISQSEFNLDFYKNFLESHKNMEPQELLNMHNAGVFYGDINQSYNDAEYFSRIDSVYHLTDYEKSLLSRNGFMVSERLHKMTFGHALLEIYDKDIPVYISADAILHTLHQSYDRILKRTEISFLIPSVTEILNKMHEKIPLLVTLYGSDPEMPGFIKDVDIYLSVARKLLNDNAAVYFQDSQERLNYLHDKIISAEGMAEEFIFSDNCRIFDWSQFKPRGHYTDEYFPQLAKYFRAMMWLGRTELYLINPQNVDSESCLSDFNDVQRQTIMTFLLNELFEESGSEAKYTEAENILKYFVGEPDNVTMHNIVDLKEVLGINSAAMLLDSLKIVEFQDSLKRQSYANQKILSQILISDPLQPDSIIPASAFLLFGQRFVIDSYVLGSVVYDRITFNGTNPCRLYPSRLDPIFALGNDAVGQLLTDELEEYHYASNLAALRYLIDSYDINFWESTIYNQWLSGIRSLNPPKERQRLPEFMKTSAFWQKQLNTQLTSWTQLRHDNLLYAKQSYTGGTTCSYPYTYIEPFPQFYEAISDIGRLGKEKFGQLNIPDKESMIRYFATLEQVCDTLRIISEKELYGTPYTEQETDFLHKVIYPFLSGSGESPYKGWYPRLIFDGDEPSDALLKTDYIVADIHTVPTDCGGNPLGGVVHVGTGPVNLGVFIADVPGFQKTAFAGPVYSYYEYTTLGFERLTDEDWLNQYLSISARPSWVNIYLADSTGNSKGPGASFVTDVRDGDNLQVMDYLIVGNYPNPFNPSTTIAFNVPPGLSFSNVTVEVYNIQGELVKILFNSELPQGNYYLSWDGTNNFNGAVSSGVYLCKVTVGQSFKTIKMTLLK